MPQITIASGLALEYESYGERGEPPVLMVMGFGPQLVAWPRDFCRRLAQGRTRWGGADRCGRHGAGVPVPHRLQRGAHRRAGCEPIVDDYRRQALQLERRGVPTVEPLAPVELELLLDGDPLDLSGGESCLRDHIGVQHAHTAAGDRSEGQFLVPGHTELAHEHHIQRRRQRQRHLIRDGHAATRQPEHDDVITPGVGVQQPGEAAACVAAGDEARDSRAASQRVT